MYTDWLLIRRLAWELERRFGAGRVRDVGRLRDGRFALLMWVRGASALVCIDVFAPTPLITVEQGELPVHPEPGFVRTAGAALRGKTLTSVRSRDGDRSLRFEFASRSRFGIEDGYALVCELVPKFGNVILVKSVEGPSGQRDVVVAAAKEFAPAENAVRSIQAGSPYEPAPLPRRGSRILSEEAVGIAAELPPEGDLHVYRRDGALVQAHVVVLPEYEDLEHQRAASLLDLLAEARTSQKGTAQSDQTEKLRRSLDRRLADHSAALQRELEHVERRLNQTDGNQALRAEGDDIYATLHQFAGAERERAKERASQLFGQYKKNAAARAHLTRRAAELSEQLDELANLRWEVERAEAVDLPEVSQALTAGRTTGRGTRLRPSSVPTRKPLTFQTAGHSRIYVGRTPLQNADLTFRLARPADLWFHVQNQPGAHVILQRDDRQEPPQEDILAAAALAALHSKAKNSPKVTVDYTQRKYVRKRPGAAPGLVYYTNPRSVLVAPGSPASGPDA